MSPTDILPLCTSNLCQQFNRKLDRCRALLGSGVPRLINGLNSFGCYMQRFGGTNKKEREENILVLYKTYPASRPFSSISFSLQNYFSCSIYGIGKQERELGRRTGGVDGTRPDSFYLNSLRPPIRERLGGEDDVLGSHLLGLDWGN